MKRRLPLFLIFLCGLILSVFLYFGISSPARFDDFCDSFFQEEIVSNSLTLHYTVEHPENYGLCDAPITLGTYDLDTFSQKKWLFSKLLTLQTISRSSLEPQKQITYDLLLSALKTELDGLAFALLEEPLIPSIGIQSQLPILLAEYTFSDETDVVNYLSLLSCLPEYFDSLLEFEEKKYHEGLFMDAESAEELIGYCQEFLADQETHFLKETFRERLSSLQIDTQKQKLYLAQNDTALETWVFPSYEKLEDFLTLHKNDGINAHGLFYAPGGTDYYAWLLQSQVGTDRSFQQIEKLLEQALRKNAATIAGLLKEHPTLLEDRQKIVLDTSNPAGLTSYLSKRASHDFPEITDVAFEICNVPVSMEPHLSPAFYLVPPIDNGHHNVIYLNNGYLKEGISFFTTLAHEAYPGHLYQTVFENASNPHPIRRLLYFGGYIEGWATYAEQFSYRYAPISEELATLLSCSREMILNLYSHLDLYIHAYGWTEEDCGTYLKKFGITGAQSIHDMFLLVKQQPANYLKYYLGYLEICELRDLAKDALGENFTDKDFHSFILRYGPAPFDLMKKYLEEWLHSSR